MSIDSGVGSPSPPESIPPGPPGPGTYRNTNPGNTLSAWTVLASLGRLLCDGPISGQRIDALPHALRPRPAQVHQGGGVGGVPLPEAAADGPQAREQILGEDIGRGGEFIVARVGGGGGPPIPSLGFLMPVQCRPFPVRDEPAQT